MERRIVYIRDDRLSTELDKIDQIKTRTRMVDELVYSYGLHSNLVLLPVKLAKERDMLSFHSQHYINFLKTINGTDDLEKYEDAGDAFGLGYDCPLLEGLYDFARVVAGGSVTAAESVIHKEADVAINWAGGWHHAQRDEAAGFCYVNDVVCAIHKLLECFRRVLYIDLDVHHGDGVENAFSFTRRVMTLSLHKYELGFYPGTGALSDIGKGPGCFHAVNVPLKDGIQDLLYMDVFDRVVGAVEQAYKPDVVVMQCGTDGLTGDPLGTFNLTLKSLGHCVTQVLSWEKPCLFVGGGGYHPANAARCWAYLTSVIAGSELAPDIPENEYFDMYGPSFELEITPSNRKDHNTMEDIEECLNIITGLESCSKML